MLASVSNEIVGRCPFTDTSTVLVTTAVRANIHSKQGGFAHDMSAHVAFLAMLAQSCGSPVQGGESEIDGGDCEAQAGGSKAAARGQSWEHTRQASSKASARFLPCNWRFAVDTYGQASRSVGAKTARKVEFSCGVLAPIASIGPQGVCLFSLASCGVRRASRKRRSAAVFGQSILQCVATPFASRLQCSSKYAFDHDCSGQKVLRDCAKN